VALVFVIGCVNIANLLLARGSTRARELALRRALGASQARLTRQLLTESLLLSSFGGAAGLVILFWSNDFLIRFVPEVLPRLNAEIGFNPQSVMTVKTRMPYPNDTKVDVYATPAQQAPFFHDLLRRCKRMPGVDEAAIGDLASLPLAHDRNNQNPPVPMVIEGRQTQSNEASLVDESIVTPKYFHLMAITLQRGRLFTDFDNDKSEAVAVINEAMAQTYWPNEDPLGKHVKLSRRATGWTLIVGVVANARTEYVENERIPQIYLSIQ